MSQEQRKETVRFGVFELNTVTRELKRQGLPVKIQAQPLALLLALVRRAGEVLSREELRNELWPEDVYVSFEQNLNRAVSKLRDTLGDAADNPRFIQTVSKRGYRFIAPVERHVENGAPAATDITLVSQQNSLKSPIPIPAPSLGLDSGVRTSKPRLLIMLVLGLIGFAGMAGYEIAHGRNGTQPSSAISIAVLRFSNTSTENPEMNFLSDALPNEISTTLSYSHALAVRPFSPNPRGSTGDLRKVASDLHARLLVTGQYLTDGSRVHLSIQTVDTSNDQVIWRDDVIAAQGDWIAIRDQVNQRIKIGLLPALGISEEKDSRTHPSNAQAYDLYLRSFALPNDGGGNSEAILLLQKSIGMDPTYAPAWQALGSRYHFEYDYSHGGSAAWDKAERAYEQALTLDPDLISAAASLVMMITEQGELVSAYAKAQKFLRQHPESGVAHFAMSYVLRYAGALQESAAHCDQAEAADPSNGMFRTCSQTFIRLGKYERALDFIRKDGSSNWAQGMLLEVYMRNGQIDKALTETRPVPEMAAPLIRACAMRLPAIQVRSLKAHEENFPTRDPEGMYHVGVVEAYCGFYSDGMHWLRQAADNNYCPAEDLDSDPILQPMRSFPEFAQLRAAAKNCRDKFLQRSKQ